MQSLLAKISKPKVLPHLRRAMCEVINKYKSKFEIKMNYLVGGGLS